MENPSADAQQAHTGSGQVSGLPPAATASRLKIARASVNKATNGVDKKSKRVRPKDRERRPASKAKICNVRMSVEEAVQLKAIATRSGQKSLQDFMYQMIRNAIDRDQGMVTSG